MVLWVYAADVAVFDDFYKFSVSLFCCVCCFWCVLEGSFLLCLLSSSLSSFCLSTAFYVFCGWFIALCFWFPYVLLGVIFLCPLLSLILLISHRFVSHMLLLFLISILLIILLFAYFDVFDYLIVLTAFGVFYKDSFHLFPCFNFCLIPICLLVSLCFGGRGFSAFDYFTVFL